MDTRVAPFAALVDLNTDLLLNCLEGLSDGEAQRRLPGGGNSVAFLAAHLVDTRHFLVSRLGRALENPMAPFLADVHGIEDIRELPSLDAIRAAWLGVSGHLGSVLAALTPAELDWPNAHRFPLADSSRLGMIA
ncbi:MAG: DinB family protein, partial [Gemmatimonadales bacterium]